jgi:RNA polymerase primary sigma factor
MRSSTKPAKNYRRYLKFRQLPYLTVEQETAIAIRMASGDVQARNKLVEHHLPLVHTMAFNFASRQTLVSFEELVEAGYEAMTKHASSFDPKKARFSTFIGFWLKAEMILLLRQKGRIVRIPHNVTRAQRTVEMCVARLKRKHGSDNIEPHKIAAHTGLGVSLVREVLEISAAENYLPIDALLPGFGELTINDHHIFSDDGGTPEDAVLASERQRLAREKITDMLKVLDESSQITPRERTIFKKYYGLGSQRVSLRELGELFNVSHERVRQLKLRVWSVLLNMTRGRDMADASAVNSRAVIQAFEELYSQS